MADMNEPSGLSAFLKADGKELYDKKSKKKRKPHFAEGGDVSPPAEEPQSPEGLDDFIAQPAPTHPGAPNEPHGLNDFLSEEINQEKYGTPGQQALAGLEGAGRGLAGPAFTAAETALGAEGENIRGRQEANPVTAGTAEAGTFLGSMLLGTGEAAAVGKVGSKIAELSGLGAEGASALSKIGAHGLQAATETALIQTGDEVSKMITQDPNQSAQTALINVGAAALLGGAGGAAFGSVSPLWKASAGNKMGRLFEDFKGRINEHLTQPEPVEAIGKELSDYYSGVKDVADEVYGPTGLKAQDVAKAVPEMSEKISGQTQDIYNKVQDMYKTMMSDPSSYPPRLVNRFQNEADRFASVATDPNASSVDIFNATQDLKNTLQGYAKFDKFVKPVDEAYDFVNKSKGLAYDLRNALEDPKVWGKAAERQQAINGAFKNYLPTLKDFEKKFTTEVAGERTIDPGKVQTYVNQAGKPNAEIKQQMLKNFIDASEKYKQVISDTHSNLGLESPVTHSSLSSVNNSFKELTPGMKLADVIVKRYAGNALGAGVGASLGHAVGAGGIGALIGEHSLGPVFNSVLPALLRPILKNPGNAAGAKAAIDYGMNVVKGEKLLDKATKGLFKSSEVLPDHLFPTSKEREKLNLAVEKSNTDISDIAKAGGDIPHYLPDHGTAISQTSAQVVNYLNSVKPQTDPKSPLDNERVTNSAAEAKYNNALDIAQQPLVVLQKIKDGRLSMNDVMALGTMYPSLYMGMRAKLSDQMMNRKSDEEPIPYRLRMGLSMFLGQPLDSTMTPQSILSIQSGYQEAKGSQPETATQPAQKPKRSTAGLNKLPGQYMTQGQSAETKKNKVS